jgi:hypothetical protein
MRRPEAPLKQEDSAAEQALHKDVELSNRQWKLGLPDRAHKIGRLTAEARNLPGSLKKACVMAMNRIQFQPEMSLFEFFGQCGTQAQCEAALRLALAGGLSLPSLRWRGLPPAAGQSPQERPVL